MNSKEIFSLAIGLSEPWFIREIELRKPEGTISGELTYILILKGAVGLFMRGFQIVLYMILLKGSGSTLIFSSTIAI